MANIPTIRDLFVNTCRGQAGVALRYKQEGRWRTSTYPEVFDRAGRVGASLSRRGLRPGAAVAVFLENRPEWPEIYMGIVCAGLTAVPVDAKLREQEVAHIVRDSGCLAAFVSAKTCHLIRDIEDHVRALSTVILVGTEEVRPLSSSRTRYLDYEDVLRGGEGGDSFFERARPPAGDPASIIYTSGTTGSPKGAVLTHRNFCSNVEACLSAMDVRSSDSFLLVLPLHHSFAFTVNLLLPMAVGAEISFVESLKTLSENLGEVAPTILAAVPLLVEKIYGRMQAGLRKNRLAFLLFALGLRAPVRRRILAGLGGRLRMVVVGGAPSSANVLKGMAAFGVPVIEGYGLTETAPVLTVNPPDCPRPGTVGKPLPGVELRIDAPGPDGAGEIVARGPNLMSGYFNDPDATRAAIRDGWFFTGDLGSIDPNGYLTITGRKKNLIVNREGKNISPEEVEACIGRSEFILETLVVGYREGGDTGERVGLIVVPDPEALDAYAARRKHPLGPAETEDLIRAEVRKQAADIADYKRPRRIQIRTEEFEKTSTGKIKRYLYAAGAMDV